MTRTSIVVPVTELKDIPVGSLFIELKDAEYSSHPPVIGIKTGDDEGGLASFKFGLSSDHQIWTSGHALVIPLCGDSDNRTGFVQVQPQQ
jgi:hypothetical protein